MSDEKSYIEGNRAAWRRMLTECLRNLDVDGDDPQSTIARLISEREETRAALRRVCDSHGDNDWPDSLHLADVVEKHLARHIL